MKFKNVTVSYPKIYFKTDITHFSSRNSTVIEWCVLELLKKVGEMPKYAEVSIDELLSRIFKIDNSDELVKPCIMDLQGNLKAISMENTIYDDTSLADVPAGSLHLTQQGLEMHEKGLLPGSNMVKTDEFLFNLQNRNIGFFKSGNLSKDPEGIQIIDNTTNLDSIPLPESEIKEFLQDLIVKNKYLSPTSVIKDISLSEDENAYSVLWNNKRINVGFTKNMVFTADGTESPSEKQLIANYVCSEANLESTIDPDFVCDFPVQNVDNEYKSVIGLNELGILVSRCIDESPAFLINEKILNEAGISINTILKSLKNKAKVIVLYGRESYSFSVESGTETSEKHLLITLPTSFDHPGIFFCGPQKTLIIGRFEIRMSEDEQSETIKSVLCAEPQKREVDLKSVSEEIFSDFSSNNEDLIYMLPAFGNDTLFLKAVDERIARIDTISERASFIASVNEKSRRFLDRAILKEDFIEKKLVLEINFDSLSCAEAENKLSEAASVPVFHDNPELCEKYAQKVLSACMVSKADDLWKLLEKAQAVAKKIKGTPTADKLFTLDILKDIASKSFSGDFQKIPEYTPFEPALKSYIEHLEKLSSHLKQCSISLFDAESVESVTQKLLEVSSEHLKKTDELLKRYRDLEKPLNEYLAQKSGLKENTGKRNAFITFMDSVGNLSKSFKSLEIQLNTIFEAIGFFFDDKTRCYEKVYITDTNALIDHPELLDSFQTINAALVIPQKVIEELDKIKDGTEGRELTDTAIQARTASRKIQEYQQIKHVSWLTVGEAHPELLPPTLEKKKADNAILSVALKYLPKKPVIITGDRNFSIIAYSKNVISVNVDEFLGIKPKNGKPHKGGKK